MTLYLTTNLFYNQMVALLMKKLTFVCKIERRKMTINEKNFFNNGTKSLKNKLI